jgi:hypothetical protein
MAQISEMDLAGIPARSHERDHVAGVRWHHDDRAWLHGRNLVWHEGPGHDLDMVEIVEEPKNHAVGRRMRVSNQKHRPCHHESRATRLLRISGLLRKHVIRARR